MKFITVLLIALSLAACGGPQNARFNDDIWHSGGIFGAPNGSSTSGGGE